MAPATLEQAPGSVVGREILRCESGLGEGRITLVGLDRTVLDALVRIEFADGRETAAVLHPNAPYFSLDGGAPRIAGYFSLGVEHILFGIDHLLFVTGLVLIVRRPWRLAKTITAFTLAHSITLALATLGFVQIPPAPVEATIARAIDRLPGA
jgi:hydrogenase/urease accessory protein HupE